MAGVFGPRAGGGRIRRRRRVRQDTGRVGAGRFLQPEAPRRSPPVTGCDGPGARRAITTCASAACRPGRASRPGSRIEDQRHVRAQIHAARDLPLRLHDSRGLGHDRVRQGRVNMLRKRAVPAASVAALLVFAGPRARDSACPGRARRRRTRCPPRRACWSRTTTSSHAPPRSSRAARWSGSGAARTATTSASRRCREGAARKGASLRDHGKWKRGSNAPGVYRYVCKVWSGMRGTVTVREPEEPPPRSSTARQSERVLGDVVQDHLP